MGDNRCVVCGKITPEGRMVCPMCDMDESNRKDFDMIEILININTIDKAKDFCNLCSKCTEEVSVYSGRYIVSGKSIMALFSLDLSKPVKVEFHGDIPKEVKEGMKKFIID